jgi:transposase-like protein
VIYTTNAIESVNMSLRKITKTRGSFPTDEAVLQIVLPGTEQHQPEVDHANTRLEGSPESLYYPV